MKSLIILVTYLILQTCANHSAQQERCEKLHSVADHNAAATCSVGHNCFSLDCMPTLPLLSNSEFHLFIEPCKHPAAILINATVQGHKFSHEFSHSETVAITSLPIIHPKIAVILDNSDSQNLVFSVLLLVQGHNYTLVPKTSFPLNNITCHNGQLVTPTTLQTTAPGPGPYSCQATCVAIHRMIAQTNSLCESTDNCLTINCNSPQALEVLVKLTSSYRIEPCTSPPTIRATFDDSKNNQHFSKNITHSTTIPIPYNIPGNPKFQVTLVDVNNYTILFGVKLLVLTQTIQILPEQSIPIDKSGCPGYTGPKTNPYCTTQSPESTETTPGSHSTHSMHSSNTHMHSNSTPTSMHSHPVSPSLNNTAAVGSDAGKLAGIIIAVILVNIAIVSASVLVTIGVVWYVFKRKNKGVYTYSHFQAMEEED